MRSGTENVPGIAGLASCRGGSIYREHFDEPHAHMLYGCKQPS